MTTQITNLTLEARLGDDIIIRLRNILVAVNMLEPGQCTHTNYEMKKFSFQITSNIAHHNQLQSIKSINLQEHILTLMQYHTFPHTCLHITPLRGEGIVSRFFSITILL